MADRQLATAMYHPPMTDLLIPLLIALVLVVMWRGPKTLPKLGEALGRGVREAKSEAAKAQDEIKARVGDGDAPSGDGDAPSGDTDDPRT
jgi:Sec-independent protein translocase protein TatA